MLFALHFSRNAMGNYKCLGDEMTLVLSRYYIDIIYENAFCSQLQYSLYEWYQK